MLDRDGTLQELSEAAAAIQSGTTQRTLIDWVVNGREFLGQFSYIY